MNSYGSWINVWIRARGYSEGSLPGGQNRRRQMCARTEKTFRISSMDSAIAPPDRRAAAAERVDSSSVLVVKVSELLWIQSMARASARASDSSHKQITPGLPATRSVAAVTEMPQADISRTFDVNFRWPRPPVRGCESETLSCQCPVGASRARRHNGHVTHSRVGDCGTLPFLI